MPLPACLGWQVAVRRINARLMKSKLFSRLAAAAMISPLAAQESNRAELEAKFKETMTGVTLTGRFSSIKDGVLSEPKSEKYTIVSVEKGNGDAWTVNAKLHYGGQEIVAPIPVQVKWAGDTAVMSVDALRIPGPNGYGNNAYSARLLIHDGTYSGTWSGGNHGGMMMGLIVKASAAAK